MHHHVLHLFFRSLHPWRHAMLVDELFEISRDYRNMHLSRNVGLKVIHRFAVLRKKIAERHLFDCFNRSGFR